MEARRLGGSEARRLEGENSSWQNTFGHRCLRTLGALIRGQVAAQEELVVRGPVAFQKKPCG